MDPAPTRIRGPYGDGADRLAQAKVAAGMDPGRIVGWMRTGGRTPKHAGIGGHVLEAYRNQGLGSAAAYLVAREAPRAGRDPVGSTGEDDPRSQRVARKLGFEEIGRDGWVISPGWSERGGDRPGDAGSGPLRLLVRPEDIAAVTRRRFGWP